MRAVAMISVLGLALGWSNAAFSESSLSGSASEKALKSEHINQSKPSLSLSQQSEKLLGTEMQSQKLTPANAEGPSNTFKQADEAGKQVNTGYSNLASSTAKQQESNALSAADVLLRELSSSSAASFNKSEHEEMMNTLR